MEQLAIIRKIAAANDALLDSASTFADKEECARLWRQATLRKQLILILISTPYRYNAIPLS